MPRHSSEAVRLATRWNAGRTTLAKLLTSLAGFTDDDADSFCISRTTQWHRLLLLLCLLSDGVVIGNRALVAVVQASELHAIYSNSNHTTSTLWMADKPITWYYNTTGRLRGTVVEHRSFWPANFPWLALDLQLTDDHLCG